MAPRGNLIGQQLAKLFSRSGDDIVEEVAQQAAKSGDDVSEAAVIANLQRETADAAQPIGSGPNLEALQRAGDDAAILDRTAELQKGSLNAPYVDAERNINAEKLGLSYDGTAQSKYPTIAGSVKSDLPSYSSPNGLPLNKNIKLGTQAFSPNSGIIASKSAPELFKYGLSPDLEKEIHSVMLRGSDKQKADALMKWAKENPKKAFAAASALGGAGYLQLKSSNDPSVNHDPNKPMVFPKAESKPITPEMINRMSPELRGIAVAKSIEQQQSSAPSKVSVSPDDLSKIAPVEDTEAPVSEEPDFVKMLEEAQAQSATNRRDANMTRYGELIGAGLGRITPEHEGSKIAREQAGQPVEDVKAKFGAHKEQQSYKKAKEELDDDAQKRDPNSEISKFYREKFGQFIPGITDKTSASHMEKALPQLTQLINTKEAAESRKESAALQREYLQENKQSQGLNKHIDTYNKSLQKNYDEFTKTQANISALDTIMSDAKNGVTPGAKDVSLLYSFISGLDPASTVREGEVQLSKGAMSLWGKIKSGTKQITGGDLLDQDTRDSFMEIMRAGAKAQENRFRKTKVNAVNAGKEKGYDPEILNRAIYGDIDVSGNAAKSQDLTTSGSTRTFKSEQNPGSIVTVKSGKKYKIGADGVTGTEIP